MKNKLFTLLLVIVCIFCITSCGSTTDVVVESLSVVASSVPTEILVTELDDKLDDIEIKVVKSDDSEEIIKLNKTMISDVDYSKLSSEGTHNITVSYEGKSIMLTLVVKFPVDNRYSVKVIYPDNTPVTSGVTVQWCTGNNCFLPQAVNDEGVAYIELEDGEYYIHLNNVPQGYTYNPNAYTTTQDNKHIEINLLALSNIAGEGSKDNPYVVTAGTYSVLYETAKQAGMKYYSFTTSEAGTYVIESLSMDKLAMNLIDPYIGFLGNDINSNPDTTGNDIKDSVNFSRSFEAEANTTYYFIIMVSSADKFPCSVEFNIRKA